MTATASAGLDLDRLAGHLATTRPELADGPLSATLIAGGRSNLTYKVRSGVRTFVLRRPPLGHVLATAHDMGREHRVISALAPTDVPVPGTLLLCADESVLGAPFYLMEYVDGTVFREPAQTAPLGDDGRRRLAYAMMDTLAALHTVDPAAVGLGDLGRPEGFLARQVKRWGAQLDQSRSRPLPQVDRLRERLAATTPDSGGRATIVHGDYRLDNLMCDPEGATVRAVLDWEMATLGDPLTDLGLLITYWDLVGWGAGFPPGADLVARYADRGGADVGSLDWHVALGCFKLAVIAEGIHYRHTLGQTVGEGFERFSTMAAPLGAHGLAALKET
jgi:aminoglycoside phosphotransferase (APT) family kinase protein